MTRDWYPLGSWRGYELPEAGRLIGMAHAVWRITGVVDLPLSDADRDVWLDAGMPDVATWKGRPVRLDLVFVAGAKPDWAEGETVQDASLTFPAEKSRYRAWHLYPLSGRWPSCSCCGEPMPCRADVEDNEVSVSLKQVEYFVRRIPGNCWSCEEPISGRQKSVTYPGDNLDLPGAPSPIFHTRAKCWDAATRYELRWVAVDPRRERILTYPKCQGLLIVHADGATECLSEPGPLGTAHERQPDCQGHATHDHGSVAACYVGDAWFASEADMPGCPRGCDRERHPGASPPKRPERRVPASQAMLTEAS